MHLRVCRARVQVKEMVQSALGGCLFLDEAYALSGGGKDGDRGDSFSDEALRTLLTETENNRTSLCVILAGYREAMEGLMRADPGLVRRFPSTIHLDDYTPAELAAIARQTAHSRFGLHFAAGLEPKLAAHIERTHAHEVHAHNASLAVQLVEAAINRLAMRLMGGAADSGGGKGADGALRSQRRPSPPPHEPPVSMPASPATAAAAAFAPAAAAGSAAGGMAGAGAAAATSTLLPIDFLIASDEEEGGSESGEAASSSSHEATASVQSDTAVKPAGLPLQTSPVSVVDDEGVTPSGS